MTPGENKKKLVDLGVSIADLARELREEFPNVTSSSMYTMVYNMIYCTGYYPKYARILNKKYNFDFQRPDRRSARELAAA